ncbi:MAG: D-aminopeptidase [Janthinobacterium lividum]
MTSALERAVSDVPHQFPGPGGACAVLRDGEILARHAWGWADAERQIPFTPDTLFRICSITKQFTCGVALETVAGIDDLDAAVSAALPNLTGPAPKAVHLCHNQSGLRDYWAVAMLHGAPAESAFGDRDAARVIRGTQTLQFEPGTRYSYCNQNFRILSDALQDRTGRSFAELLRRTIFDPAGMHTALLAADTAALPDGTTGYEGTQDSGFRPAKNRIVWTGDAGIAASLDDMIVWERFIDRTRDDPASLYNRLSAPVAFRDGAPASYGYGLGRRVTQGRAITSHGGALRGWRSYRLHVAAERLSVVVLFNHMADAQHAAQRLLNAALGQAKESLPAEPAPMPPIAGAFIEPETGLCVRIQQGAPGKLMLRYNRFPEILTINPDGTAGSADGVLLRQEGEAVWMDRSTDHQSSRLIPLAATLIRMDIAGTYRCEELQAELMIVNAGNVLYGAFSGVLGQSRMELLTPVASDVWTLPCPRALDHTPPGDWTVALRRDGGGKPTSLELGCWLARKLTYQRQ